VFKASAFRSSTDTEAAATGWASEREGDGEINEVACLENTETSAIGRALANLGFTASIKRASREEMEKAERARSRLYRTPERSQLQDRVAERSDPPYVLRNRPARDASLASRDRVTDVMELVLEAGNRGMPADFLGELEQRVKDKDLTPDDLLTIERRVRHWLLHHAKPATKVSQDTPGSPPSVNSPDQ